MRMTRAAGLLIAACAAAGGYYAWSARLPASIAEPRQKVIAQLKDPESARFRNEFFSMSEHGENPVKSLCGEFNAKNAYGGYPGFKRYIVAATGMVMIEGQETDSFDPVWTVWCARPLP